MNTINRLLMVFLAAMTAGVSANEAAEAGATSSGKLLSVHVDRVVIDTDGLAAASETLAGSVDRLAQAIRQMSLEQTNLSDAQQQVLVSAMQSVEQASQSLTALSHQLPASADGLGERLPGMLDAARDSIVLITQSLPSATENARQLVNDTLDAAVLRLSIYTFVLLAAVALALIALCWFLYWQYLGPLARKLDELVGAPEHFDNMSRNMKDTSANLQAMQLRRGPRGPAHYRRA